MENDTKVSADGIISFVWSAWEEIGLTVTNFWKTDSNIIAKEIGIQHRALANIYNSPSINLQVPSVNDANPGYISSIDPSSKATNVQQTSGQPRNDYQFCSVKRRPYWNDTHVPPYSTSIHRYQDSEVQRVEPTYGEWMHDPSNPFNELEQYTITGADHDQLTTHNNCLAPQDICIQPLQQMSNVNSAITSTNPIDCNTGTYENDYAYNPIPFINEQSCILQEQSINQPLPLDLSWIQSMMPNYNGPFTN